MSIAMNDPAIRAKWNEVRRLYPWYRLLPGGNQGREWCELPLLTQERLLPYYEQNAAAQGADMHVYRTSGTSGGKRKAIVYDAADEEAYVREKSRLFSMLLQGAEAKVALSDMGTGHAAATAPAVFERLGMTVVSVAFHEPAERHLAAIADNRPEVLYTMPSILDRLLHAAPAGFDWGVRRVLLVGEPAPPAWRQRAAERLGFGMRDVVDTYGSIEIGTIAYWDAALGRYILLDGLLAEGVAPEQAGLAGMTLPAGEEVLVLTSLVRRRFPALRYVTYDVVRDLRTDVARGGRRRTTFAAIVKRIGPELKHGEKISLYDIENAVCRHATNAEVRVFVRSNRLHVYLLGDPPVDTAAIDAIRASLHDAIPDIGAMIRSGILEAMHVQQVGLGDTALLRELAGEATVKLKKLHVRDS